jgi:hypothetical protein
MINFFEKENSKKVYLSIFRIYIGLHIIKKLLFALPYLNLIYGNNSFVTNTITEFYGTLDLTVLREYNRIFIYIILITAIFFMFGIGRYITSVVLFILMDILQRLNPYPLNGGDNLLKFILLYFTFCNCYQYFCFNNKTTIKPIEVFLTNISSFCMTLHLCLVYFISAIHKIHSDVWFNGIATYYTLMHERFSATKWNSTLAKNGVFVTISTYYTMFWELTFPFLVFITRFRNYYILGGIILHLGIYIFMMIHDFQILYIMIYGLFYTDADFIRLKIWCNEKTIFIKKKISKFKIINNQ